MISTGSMQIRRPGAADGAVCFADCWKQAETGVACLATSAASELHGPAHWRAVALAGGRICRSMPEADLPTVLLFAITHDACRLTDDDDPQHGHRSADAIGSLLGGWSCDLAPWRRQLLVEACRYHADLHLREVTWIDVAAAEPADTCHCVICNRSQSGVQQ